MFCRSYSNGNDLNKACRFRAMVAQCTNNKKKLTHKFITNDNVINSFKNK